MACLSVCLSFCEAEIEANRSSESPLPSKRMANAAGFPEFPPDRLGRASSPLSSGFQASRAAQFSRGLSDYLRGQFQLAATARVSNRLTLRSLAVVRSFERQHPIRHRSNTSKIRSRPPPTTRRSVGLAFYEEEASPATQTAACHTLRLQKALGHLGRWPRSTWRTRRPDPDSPSFHQVGVLAVIQAWVHDRVCSAIAGSRRHQYTFGTVPARWMLGWAGSLGNLLERLLDGVLHLLEIVGGHTRDLALERLFDLIHVSPALLVVHKVDRNTLAAESARAADTVELLLLEADLVGSRSDAHRKVVHRGRERSRKEHQLARLGHRILDADRLLAERLLIQHVVRLVQHKHLDRRRLDALALDHVERLAWRAHDELRIDLLAALHLVRQTEARGHIGELGHGAHHVHDLACELTRRRKHDRLRLLECIVDAREHGEDEGGRLARAGLRLADHVLGRVLQQQRQCLFLDLAWLLYSGELGSACWSASVTCTSCDDSRRFDSLASSLAPEASSAAGLAAPSLPDMSPDIPEAISLTLLSEATAGAGAAALSLLSLMSRLCSWKVRCAALTFLRACWSGCGVRARAAAAAAAAAVVRALCTCRVRDRPHPPKRNSEDEMWLKQDLTL
ncbi:hypothetical protein L1887_51711 [Cichorium endivia]|nr:hypothetical protein L1887_51711 [Cichorium endivia]